MYFNSKIFLGFVVFGLLGCINNEPVCDYDLKLHSYSPNGKSVAHAVDIGCGATSGFVTWVTVSDKDADLKPKAHKIAVLEGIADEIYWINNREIRVEGNLKLFSLENDRYKIVLDNANIEN